jgi:glucokinase
MSYASDSRVVLTLDAGGTNFVFSAVRGDREVVEAVTLASNAHDLRLCLDTIVLGFTKAKEQAPAPPVAISFAFPGPADYPTGIIGDLGNLPAFRGGGIALGPMLEDRFGVPVLMNNDGDLFALGEAIAGLLPWANGLLAAGGSPKRFRNLFGATFGTGFGGGIVQDGRLWQGDNSAGGEIWLLRNKLDPRTNIEEAVSIRAIRRVYAEKAGIAFPTAPEPRDIFEIAKGTRPGSREAALEAFRRMGEAAGDALASAITLVDGLVVIGGGLTGAASKAIPAPRAYSRLIARMETASSMLVLGSSLLRKIQISPPAELSPIHRRPSWTMPPPKPVPKVAPNRLWKRLGLLAFASCAFTHGRNPAMASPKAKRSPSLLMKTGTPKRSASIGPSAMPPPLNAGRFPRPPMIPFG